LIRALLLDALGTLVELEAPAPRLRELLRTRNDISVSEEEAQEAVGAEMTYYRAHLDEGCDADSLAALRRRCAEALRDALPSKSRPTDLDALVVTLLDSLRFRGFPDAAPALEAARNRGLRSVVVSNWDCSLPDVLDRVGLAPLLDGIVASAPAGARKPSAAIFERGLSLAGVGPSEAIHVGDTVTDDIEGARAAGIEAVLLRRDGGAGPPGVKTIATLAELEALSLTFVPR
jgi:putative hydrolase of the HAD superfamily